MNKYSVIILFVFIASCTESNQSNEKRWYSQKQIDDGAAIFISNCASCHGTTGQGLEKDWKKPLADGSYPAPPLNGSAHTWHHPLKILKRTIRDGGIPLGGKMPPFKDELSNEEIDAALAFIQDQWNDKIYSAWEARGGLQ